MGKSRIVPAAPAAGDAPFRSVVRPEVVKTCVEELLTRRIHPTFAAYLALKRLSAREGRTDRLRPNIQEFFNSFLDVPDGPPGKRYLRPFWDQQARAGQWWLNPNVAGSFAQSSLRSGVSPLTKVVDVSGQRAAQLFSFKTEHWKLARQHLLGGHPIPVVPLGVFLYRDFAYNTPRPVSLADVVNVFRYEFGYDAELDRPTGPTEFDYLYQDDSGVRSASDWFVEAPQE